MMHFQGTQKPNIKQWLFTFKFQYFPSYTFYFSKQALVLIKSLSKKGGGDYAPLLGDKRGGSPPLRPPSCAYILYNRNLSLLFLSSVLHTNDNFLLIFTAIGILDSFLRWMWIYTFCVNSRLRIFGEESNEFTNSLGNKIVLQLNDKKEDTQYVLI